MYMRLSLLALLTAAVLVSAPPLPAQEVRPLERVSLRTDQALDIFLDVIRDSKEKKDWPRALRALEEIERFIRTNGDEYILPVSGSVGSAAGTLYTGAREAAFRELASSQTTVSTCPFTSWKKCSPGTRSLPTRPRRLSCWPQSTSNAAITHARFAPAPTPALVQTSRRTCLLPGWCASSFSAS